MQSNSPTALILFIFSAALRAGKHDTAHPTHTYLHAPRVSLDLFLSVAIASSTTPVPGQGQFTPMKKSSDLVLVHTSIQGRAQAHTSIQGQNEQASHISPVLTKLHVWSATAMFERRGCY
eukprot:764324-Pelagomonas_calceolata.AAC.3